MQILTLLVLMIISLITQNGWLMILTIAYLIVFPIIFPDETEHPDRHNERKLIRAKARGDWWAKS